MGSPAVQHIVSAVIGNVECHQTLGNCSGTVLNMSWQGVTTSSVLCVLCVGRVPGRNEGQFS